MGWRMLLARKGDANSILPVKAQSRDAENGSYVDCKQSSILSFEAGISLGRLLGSAARPMRTSYDRMAHPRRHSFQYPMYVASDREVVLVVRIANYLKEETDKEKR
jgi:hypothetical protein